MSSSEKKQISRDNKPTGNRRKFIKGTFGAAIATTIVPRYVLGGRGFTAPSDRITLGYIGTGKQARGLVKAFAPKAQALAAADVDKQKLELFHNNTMGIYADLKGQPAYKGLDTYGDFQQMLVRKDIDAVVIATPDHWHAVCAVMAANEGKHVYCEKPLAHTVEEGRAMVNAMAKNKVVLQTGSMQRSWKNFRHACELVRNGYIGTVKEVQVNVGKPAIACDLAAQQVPSALDWDRWLGPAAYRDFNAELAPPVEKDIFPNWRNYKEFGGGILSDWGAHMFDIAQWGLGMDRTGPVKLFPPDGNKYKNLTMIYENGVVLKHQDFGRNFGVRFIGSAGTLDISRDYLDTNPASIVTAEIKPAETHLYYSDDHYQDWLDAIRSGKPPICDVETGHRSSSLCCIANIAYWVGSPLEWDPVKETFTNHSAANEHLKARLRASWSIA